ncbi:aminoglycoside phosphotransferase family protein [Streptosporangium sp. NPDC004631]
MALRAWNGDGAVRPLHDDPATGAMLLERLDTARPLSRLHDDPAALRILSELLARPVSLPAPDGLPLTEILGLDRRRAAGWTLGRVPQNALWDVEDGGTALQPEQVAIARALLDGRPAAAPGMTRHEGPPGGDSDAEPNLRDRDRPERGGTHTGGAARPEDGMPGAGAGRCPSAAEYPA